MEQDAERLLWSSYRTIGAGWPDFYALLREPFSADAEALRLSINALYAHAGANRDHRDLRRRFYYQMLQEKVLPEARRVLLDESARASYDEQWNLHQANDPTAVSYERFLAALPRARQASGQLDTQIAAELTARLEAQLAAQRALQDKAPEDEMTADEMGALPVSSPPEVEAAGSAANLAVGPEDLDAAHTAHDLAPLQVLVSEPVAAQDALPAANESQTLESQTLESQVLEAQALEDEAAQPMRVRRAGHLLGGSAPALAAASGVKLRGAASRPRIAVGLSNEELRAIGRRSQRRWVRRSALRLGLGATAVALLGAGTTWALLGRAPSLADREAEARLQASVENAISRAIARSERAQPQSTPATPAAVSAPMQASNAGSDSGAASGAASDATSGVSDVAVNVPRLRLDTLLQNADFEGLPNCSDGDLQPWKVWSGGNNSGLGSAFAVGAGQEQDARSGRWRLVFWKDVPFEASVSQVVPNLRPGLYQLNAWVKCSGGQEFAGIVVADFGGARIHFRAPASKRWTPVTIRNIRVTSGKCKIGFYTRSQLPKKWLIVDAIEFQRQN